MTETLRAPFPWFGGKRRVAADVWRAFGHDVPNYVEPFAGSLAVMLAREGEPLIETVNDADCYLANFWRAVKFDPEAVAHHADWPVNEADLHARHRYLVWQGDFRERMKTDALYFDPLIAGWWVWGLCAWIGSGWCSEGNWNPEARPRGEVPHEQRRRIQLQRGGRGVHSHANSVNWQRFQVNGRQRGIHAQSVSSEWETTPLLRGSRGAAGQGIHSSGLTRKKPGLGNGSGSGTGVHSQAPVLDWMRRLCDRLRRVRVCCGDWTRVMTPSALEQVGVTGVFIDPPYLGELRTEGLYGVDSNTISDDVRVWCEENGANPKLRIALCGLEGEHNALEKHGWWKHEWKASGGYSAAAGNADAGSNERIWFSPACAAAVAQGDLFNRKEAS